MQALWLMTALLLAAANDNSKVATPSARVLVPVVFTAQSLERRALPALHGPVTLRLDALSQTVELHAPQDTKEIAAQFAKTKGGVCPQAQRRGPTVVLHCRSARFTAQLEAEKGKWFLKLGELRGLPWLPGVDGPPDIAYPPEAIGLGGGCPGTTLAGQAECERAQGKHAEAVKHFTAALDGPDRSLAALRLGDSALAERDDPLEAAAWYQKAGTKGAFGRLAMSRLCELTGSCLRTDDERRIFDAIALPEPLRSELELRLMRVQAFTERTASAITDLAKRLRDPTRPDLCAQALPLCQTLVLAALKNDDRATQALGLDLYLLLRPRSHAAPADRRFTQAAAAVAGTLGAPRYGANVLAAMTAEVPADELEEHLLRTAELYLEADDDVRARVVVDYARARFGPRRLNQPMWRAVVQGSQASRRAPGAALSDATEKQIRAEQQLAEALLSSARAGRALPQETP